MSEVYNGKVVIITGSSMGIGKEVARLLAAQKAKVVINARNPERLRATESELKSEGYDVFAVAGDVSLDTDCHRLIDLTLKHYGKIDVLVNNAGISMRGRLEELSLDVISKIYEINVIGPVKLARLAISHIKKSKGSIVFISSLVGIKGLPLISVYSSAKMALTAIVESMRAEHVTENVHVGIVYVGYTEIEEGKTAMGKDGNAVTLDARKSFFVSSTATVAKHVVRNISKRKRRTVIGGIGITYTWLLRFFPRFMEYLTVTSYRKLKKIYK